MKKNKNIIILGAMFIVLVLAIFFVFRQADEITKDVVTESQINEVVKHGAEKQGPIDWISTDYVEQVEKVELLEGVIESIVDGVVSITYDESFGYEGDEENPEEQIITRQFSLTNETSFSYESGPVFKENDEVVFPSQDITVSEMLAGDSVLVHFTDFQGKLTATKIVKYPEE